MSRRLIITTGDSDGIGTEVAARALAKTGPQAKVQFIVFRSPETPKSHISLFGKKWKRVSVGSLSEALQFTDTNSKTLIEVVTALNPHECVRLAAEACTRGHASGMITGPMSKKMIGHRVIGHTEILKDVTKAPHAFMAFLGSKFNVVSATGHVPIKEVSSQLSSDNLIRAATLAYEFSKRLPRKQRQKPLAVVGLNPHAGENGTIGIEEKVVYAVLSKELTAKKIPFVGPLVPDAAYTPDLWDKYSFYVSPYHDQALIPFKVVHGKSGGAHLTLGLPFVRTSVDHGTAKDIFGKNKADAGSMIDAIRWAVLLTASKR